MQIKPSATIRQNYNEVSALCKKTKEPVYLTKNGEGDLVVMDIVAFQRREKMLEATQHLRQRIMEAIRSLGELPARFPFFITKKSGL